MKRGLVEGTKAEKINVFKVRKGKNKQTGKGKVKMIKLIRTRTPINEI